MPFSRLTFVELADFLANGSHASLDRLVLRFDLENIASRAVGSREQRAHAIMRHLMANPEAVGPLGGNLGYELIETVLHEEQRARTANPFGAVLEEQWPRLIRSLRRDGYG